MQTILIVDDHEQNRYLLRSILEAAGYAVVTAANGAEALALARREPPALIVADILMPVMDGYMLCREWQQDAQLRAIPFVFLTATYTDTHDAAFAQQLGAAAFIVKPVESEELLTTLRTVLSEQGAIDRPVAASLLEQESTYYRLYNEVLIHKLEDKMLALEQANQALQASERFARATLDGLSAHIAILDETGTILAVNASWRAFGSANPPLAANACEGANYLAVCDAAAGVNSAEAAAFAAAIRAVLAGAQPSVAIEYPCHAPQEKRWFVGRITRFPGDGPPRVVVTHENITERKLAELALATSEQTLRRSQEVAQVGHWTWDTRANRVHWSDEMKRIFGLDPQTFAGDLNAVIRHAIHPDDQARVFRMNEAVVKEGRPAETEYRVVWPDGSIHQVWAMPADRVIDGSGNVIELSGIVQEITARRQGEIERERLFGQVQAQAEQLSQVMNSVPEGVLLLDADSRVLLANPQARTYLPQLTADDPAGPLTALGDRSMASLLTSPPPGQWHLVQINRRSFEVIAQPVENVAAPSGWVLVIRDVTEERAFQQQLQRQERLAAIGQMAAGIAHDFNNIMSVIVLYAQLASRAPELTEQNRERLRTINEQAMRAAQLIRQILDFSRRAALERVPLDLLPLLNEQVRLLQRTLPDNIVVRLDYTPGEYWVKADPTRMEQVVMNLAVNARDAMPEGGELRFELTPCPVLEGKHAPVPGMHPGAWVCLSVSDTGAGIPPAILDHIFEPFFTTKEPGQGTGLGLAQVHGIVGQHDGQIVVASQVGMGTRFTIYLPELDDAASAGNGAQSASLAAPPVGHGERVLIVEDDGVLRTSLADGLKSLNYRVQVAGNGEEALAWLAAADPPVDVILSDVVMPKLSGVALFNRLADRGQAIPFILMTGHAFGAELEAARARGVRAVLQKPPSIELLARTIAETLRT